MSDLTPVDALTNLFESDADPRESDLTDKEFAEYLIKWLEDSGFRIIYSPLSEYLGRG